jgi:hypothetical protein
MDQVQDANGQAEAALGRVVQGFGVPVLSQAEMLEGLLNDDVPQLPRQIAMLTEAARCGMADLLAERVKQGVSAGAAISMVATEVTSKSAMDTAGALWAARAFAAALGYAGIAADSVPPQASMPPSASVPETPAGPDIAAAPPTYVVNRGGPVLPEPGLPADNQQTVRPGAQPWATNPDVPPAEPATSAPQTPPGQSAPQVPLAQQWQQGQQPPPPPWQQGQQWPQGQQPQGQQPQGQQPQGQQPQGQQPQGPQQWAPQAPQWQQGQPQGPQQWAPQAPAWQTNPQWAPPVAVDPKWPVSPQGAPLGPIATGVAVCAALATGLSVLLQLFWSAVHRTHSGETVFWLSTAVLIIAGIVIAIWTAQDRRTGAGLAATIGLAIPGISWLIYESAFAGNVSAAESERHELLGVSVIALLAALVAALIALAALASRRQLGRQKADPLTIILVILGVLYPLSNILAQEKFENFQFGNVLGSGVRSYYILWGILFLVLFALPPLLSALFAPGSRAQLALWIGWVLLVLAWQISASPVDGEKAATGLVLSWLAWVAVLVCTLILAARGPQARPAVTPAAAVSNPWPGSPV